MALWNLAGNRGVLLIIEVCMHLSSLTHVYMTCQVLKTNSGTPRPSWYYQSNDCQLPLTMGLLRPIL